MKHPPKYLYRLRAFLRENESFPGHITVFKATTGPNHRTEKKTQILLLLTTLIPILMRGGGCPHTTEQFSSTTWVSYNWSQFWYYLPGDGISPPRRPRPCQMPIASLGCYLCFWPYGYRLEVPTIPSLGSINLLEQLAELREIVFSLDYRFITKG